MSTAYRKRRSSSKLIKYRIHTLMVIVVLASLLGSFWPAYIWSIQIDDNIIKVAQEKKRMLDQNQALREEVRRLNTSEYVEQLARQDLGLVKPGEVPITQAKPVKPN